jgi:hypothetical protein
MKLSYLQHLRLQARADRACGTLFRGQPALDPTPTFVIDGTSYTLAEMLAANASDPDLCAWLCEARVGERFPGHIECGRAA